MSALDADLATKLSERITELQGDEVKRLPNALPVDQYHQCCGYIEAMRQVRDILIPQILEELQRR